MHGCRGLLGDIERGPCSVDSCREEAASVLVSPNGVLSAHHQLVLFSRLAWWQE